MQKISFLRKIPQPLKLIFPDKCFVCGARENFHTSFLCNNCFKHMQQPMNSYCEFCGAPIKNNVCDFCNGKSFLFDFARSVFVLNPVLRELIHQFKYKEMTKIGTFLGDIAGEFMQKNKLFENTDFIVPIPLHSVKKRMRGFNQSEILSKAIAKKCRLTHAPDLLKRSKFTQTQTKLGRKERAKNVADAFTVNRKYVIQDRNILLIDDVFTTGSTVNSISKILKNSMVKQVFVLTIARA